jgi:hypothetical protein
MKATNKKKKSKRATMKELIRDKDSYKKWIVIEKEKEKKL